MAYKIVLAGDSGVGKSSLLATLKEYTPRKPVQTVGADFHPMDVCIDGKTINVHFWENRAVSPEEGPKLAKQHDFLFLETSAFQGDGIIPVLEELVRKMLPVPVHPKPANTVCLTPQAYDTAVNKERSWCERMC